MTSTVSVTPLVSDVSGDINNGIKKEFMGKDAARIWISDDIKVQNFSQSHVSCIFNSPLGRYIVLPDALVF